MSRRPYLRATILSAGLFSAGFAAIAVLSPRPQLMWNASASAPIGLYRIDSDAPVTLGQLVAVEPSAEIARFLDDRRYLPSGVPLMKHVAALPGQQVCRIGAVVMIDGRPTAVAKLQDRTGRALPVWRGCHRVRAGEIFLLNPAPDSLDGRYFGVLPAAGLIGTAHPLLTRSAPPESHCAGACRTDPPLSPRPTRRSSHDDRRLSIHAGRLCRPHPNAHA